jgi:uncharacterized protein (DUF3820 family)
MVEYSKRKDADFKAAKQHVLPFGKFRGKTLDEIAESDDGLRYLDWLRGQSFVGSVTATWLRIYLDNPAIKSELAKLVGGSDD